MNRNLTLRSIMAVIIALGFLSPLTISAQTMILYETFDQVAGKGGNDSIWSGLSPNDVNTAAFDNDGWTINDVCEGYKCVIVKGNGDQNNGSIVTPALGMVGDMVLTFRAGAWNTLSEYTEIQLKASQGATISPTKFTLTKGAFQTFNVSITGATERTKITFETSNTKVNGRNRFFLDDILIRTIANPDETPSTYFFFDANSCSAVWNGHEETVSTPLLTFEGDEGSIIFSSSNQSVVADENISNGAVVISGTGQTTITATRTNDSFPTTETASYTLTVTEPQTNYGTYFCKANYIVSGKSYLLISRGGTNDQFYSAISQPTEFKGASAGRFLCKNITSYMVSNDTCHFTDPAYTFIITESADGYTLQQHNGTYIVYTKGKLNTSANEPTLWYITYNKADSTFCIQTCDKEKVLKMNDGLTDVRCYSYTVSGVFGYSLLLYEQVEDITSSIQEEPKPLLYNTISTYDISGRRIETNCLQSLPHGIYILNGRKIIR